MTDSPGDSARGSASSIASRPRRDPGKYAKRCRNSSNQSRILAERGVRSYDAAFQARSAGDFPDGATRIDRHDAVEDSEVVFDVLGDDMVIGLGCQV